MQKSGYFRALFGCSEFHGEFTTFDVISQTDYSNVYDVTYG